MGIPITGLYITYFALSIYALFTLTTTQIILAYILFYFLLEVVMSLFIHRWATHNLWNPPVWFQNIMTVVSMSALIGTPISYSAWHRNHHRYADTIADPHSPKYSSWFYIIFRTHEQDYDLSLCGDRLRNKWQLLLTKYENPAVYIINVILFLVLPFDIFLMWATAVAMTTFWVMAVTGIMCHLGKVKDVPYMYPFAFSESFHKQHHIKPQLKHCKYDPWVWLIQKLGWT